MTIEMRNVLPLFILTLHSFVLGHPDPFLKNMFGQFPTEFDPSLSGSKAAEEDTKASMRIYRLPDVVTPTSYTLRMVPNLIRNFTFTGEVDIVLIVKKRTKSILLHSHRLDVRSVNVSRAGKKLDLKYSLLPADQILKINVNRWLLQSNVITVKIKFAGMLLDEMNGFYRSSYNVGNTTKWLATTKFEPTRARWAFPCFDEPKFRATFDISVARYSHQTAISNMPLKFTSPQDPSIDHRVWDVFEKTPPMPTYLIAFIVSEFSNITDADGRVRMWARENAIGDGKYGQIKAASLLKRMEQFVGIPYTLPKLDLVAIPDFKSGAMENWGLTTYRERYTLYNEKLFSEANKEYLTEIIAHELSHQWFGDLVTLAWWDYVWLNEGFATYFEYFLTATEEPAWRLDEQFVVGVTQYALSVDGISVHRPMTDKLQTLDEITGSFDAISYDKAGSVIRMIEHVVSPTTFKNALHLYLHNRRKAGGVAEPIHLYDAFEKQMQKEGKFLRNSLPISLVFDKYANQPGYPYVTISRKSKDNHTFLLIQQEPYKSPRSDRNVTEKTWPVPLSCTKQSHPDFSKTQPTFWLLDDKPMKVMEEIGSDEWILCNLQQSGYYRINYDTNNWNLLIKQLHSSHLKIHHLNRAQLIDDCLIFAYDEKISFEFLFDILRYLEHEHDPIPWYTGLRALNDLIEKHEATKVASQIQRFAKHLIEHFYNYIGFYDKDGDDYSVKYLRSFLLKIACQLGITDAVTKAQMEFSTKTNLTDIQANVKEAVLCTAIQESQNITIWNKFWNLYKKSNVDVEKTMILSSFGCATDYEIYKKLLNKLVDNDQDIRQQHYIYVYRLIRSSQHGVMGALLFIQDILPKLGNYTNGQDIVKQLLWNINTSIKFPNQLHILRHLIEDTKKLNQQEYEGIRDIMEKIKTKAEMRIGRIDMIAAKIAVALNGPKMTTLSPLTTMEPSVATNSIPKLFTLTIILIVKFL